MRTLEANHGTRNKRGEHPRQIESMHSQCSCCTLHSRPKSPPFPCLHLSLSRKSAKKIQTHTSMSSKQSRKNNCGIHSPSLQVSDRSSVRHKHSLFTLTLSDDNKLPHSSSSPTTTTLRSCRHSYQDQKTSGGKRQREDLFHLKRSVRFESFPLLVTHVRLTRLPTPN